MTDIPTHAGILLDTNVVSEMMSTAPNPVVATWWDGQGALFISAIVVAEIQAGIATLPEGRRKRTLEEEADTIIHGRFDQRVLPFGLLAAQSYKDIVAVRGRPLKSRDMADCMIAAIARSLGMAVATRNVRDFEGIGVDVIDPWAGGSGDST